MVRPLHLAAPAQLNVSWLTKRATDFPRSLSMIRTTRTAPEQEERVEALARAKEGRVGTSESQSEVRKGRTDGVLTCFSCRGGEDQRKIQNRIAQREFRQVSNDYCCFVALYSGLELTES